MRLTLVLALALGVIVGGGLAVPVLMHVLGPAEGRLPISQMEANAGEARPEKARVKAAEPPLPPVPAGLDQLSERFRAVARHIKPAVVWVGVSQTVEAPSGGLMGPEDFFRRFFGNPGGDEGDAMPMPAPRRRSQPRTFQRRGLGSGVIVDAAGFILTNNHVVRDADEITVRLADGREFTAEVVGTDPPTDIAVIRIKAEDLPVAPLGDSSKMEVGDWVLAVGSPFGLDQTVTSGIISATGRAGMGITDYESFLQTDAAINPGNSGGPLVNMAGQVIGINTAIASRTGGYMGVGFSVPVNIARKVMEIIREKGKVVRGWLGVAIQPLTKEMAESMGLPSEKGALIGQVFDDSPAKAAGLEAGDVVVEWDGEAVEGPAELQNAVAWTAPDTTVSAVVLRDGKKKTVKVTVTTRTEEVAAVGGRTAPAPGKPAEIKDLGIEVSGVTPEAAERYGYEPGQGVLIAKVEPGSVAARANLQEGMLILAVGGEKVKTVAELKDALKKQDLAKGVPLLVRSGDRQVFMLLKKRS
jgi:serine protease Do